MKVSNVGDVGQMRRRSGTSTNMSVRPESLIFPLAVHPQRSRYGVDLQAQHAECEENVEVEEVGYSERNAQEYA